jgi:hypothetical protein
MFMVNKIAANGSYYEQKFFNLIDGLNLRNLQNILSKWLGFCVYE